MPILLNGALFFPEFHERCKALDLVGDYLFLNEELGEGLFKVTVMKKFADPQWKYPSWGRVEDALFGDEAEAEAYVKERLR